MEAIIAQVVAACRRWPVSNEVALQIIKDLADDYVLSLEAGESKEEAEEICCRIASREVANAYSYGY